MFDWLLNFTLIERSLIISGIIIGFLFILLVSIYFIKPKIKRKNFIYFYAFSAGFILIVSVLGLYSSITNAAKISLLKYDHAGKEINHTEYVWKTSLVVIGTIFMSVGLILRIKYYTNKTLKTKNDIAVNEKRKKIVGVVFMLTHRIPASFLIGSFLSDPAGEETALLAILLHLIPELLVVFYRQIDAGVPKKKAFWYSVLVKVIFLPLIVGSAMISKNINSLWWFKITMYASGGTFLMYASLNELAPDFLNGLNHRTVPYEDKISGSTIVEEKRISSLFIKTVLIFAIGIAIAAAVMSFHYH